ncbi:MAG: response regulator, partial [Paracoccaceae bacterium]
MGGIAAMRRLRALGGAGGAVPVVALTAYARSADRQLALDAGMDAYLAKPIVVAEFYDLLRRLLPEGGDRGD